MSALSGVLVVALEQAVAAPYASSRLADSGARVIKIERPEGDFARRYDSVAHGESAYFVWLNRGKESIALDIKADADRALLARMIARADVFIQNLAPGAAARAGFGSNILRARHPRLITCDISGYGADGPYREMKAYDLLVQSESGLAAITGSPEAPGRVGVSVADIGAGMYAYAAILEALIARERTDRGEALAVSLFDAIADWMTVPLLHSDYGHAPPPRVGLAHPTIAPYGLFTCSDGGQMVVAVQNEREWRTLCLQVLDRPDMAADPAYADNSARMRNRPRLDGEIGAFFGRFPLAEMRERLLKAGIAFGALNDVPGLSRHPQLRRMSVDTPTGPVAMPAPPAQRSAPAAPGPVPGIGAHSEALRREFAD